MKKEIITPILLLLLFVAASLSFVIAAGSSSGGSSSGGSSNNNDEPSTTPATPPPPTITTCENFNTVRERVSCRFQNSVVARAESATVIEEACRGHARQAACTALYRRSSECYDVSSPREKKRCFLEKSGININAGGTFRAAPDTQKREYVVLLLYELQERIESMEERGALSADQAAHLVTKIVEIKKLILEDKPRSEIVPKIQQFKTDYRATTGRGSQPENYNCEANSDCELRTYNYCCGTALDGINRCYSKQEPEQQTPSCDSNTVCPILPPAPTSCECIYSACTGVAQ
ncbi:MAG: hypothetical protein AABY16_04160 [Nanoarchaeota archaeon]